MYTHSLSCIYVCIAYICVHSYVCACTRTLSHAHTMCRLHHNAAVWIFARSVPLELADDFCQLYVCPLASMRHISFNTGAGVCVCVCVCVCVQICPLAHRMTRGVAHKEVCGCSPRCGAQSSVCAPPGTYAVACVRAHVGFGFGVEGLGCLPRPAVHMMCTFLFLTKDLSSIIFLLI